MMSLYEALEKIKSQGPKLYAKLRVQNFPYTVVPTDLILAHRLKDVNVGDVLELDEVREIGSPDFKLLRAPTLPRGAVTVRAIVMEHTHGAKVRAAMRKQRKGRRPLRTIKPRMTVLRVTDIQINPNFVPPAPK